MIDLQPWACACGARFADTHAAITEEMVNHTRGPGHVIRKQPRMTETANEKGER